MSDKHQKQIRCGVQYKVGTPAPRHAKYAVWYWGYVVYHTKKSACETTLGKLSYYEREDAQIVRL